MAIGVGSSTIAGEDSTSVEVKQIQAIIGEMFTENEDDGIQSHFDEERGKINLDVQTTVQSVSVTFDDVNAAFARHLRGRDQGEYWLIINKDNDD